jgi:phage terminase large subunit-like protein
MTQPTSSSLCEPRYETARSKRDTFGHQVASVAERLGFPLLPWQKQVALVGGELDPDTDLPAYRDVVITVPRQSGKTTLVLAWEIQRALGWMHLDPRLGGGPQRISYSAQTGNDARKKLVEDQFPVLEPIKSRLGIKRCLKGMGNEAIEFLNGSRLTLLASTEDSGHGKTLHLGVRDEFFADTDGRRAQSMIPAMITVDSAQMLTISTAGTDASVPLNDLVREGRAAVEAGKRSDIAYFEWSAPEGADMSDESLWWTWMPALGHTQSIRAIRQAQQSPDMTEGEFRRAFGNLATRSDERLISADAWDLVNAPRIDLRGRVAFGVDVHEERSSAAIVAVSEHREVEVIALRSGVEWVVDEVIRLCEKFDTVAAFDAAGPVATLAHELAPLGRRLVPVVGPDMTKACGQFFDDVVESRLKVKRDKGFDLAVAGARRRFVGDAWKWARRDSSVDVTPLVAATVALWTVGIHKPRRAIDNVW